MRRTAFRLQSEIVYHSKAQTLALHQGPGDLFHCCRYLQSLLYHVRRKQAALWWFPLQRCPCTHMKPWDTARHLKHSQPYCQRLCTAKIGQQVSKGSVKPAWMNWRGIPRKETREAREWWVARGGWGSEGLAMKQELEREEAAIAKLRIAQKRRKVASNNNFLGQRQDDDDDEWKSKK